MVFKLGNHARSAAAPRPTASYVAKHLVHDATGHWFWAEREPLRRHDSRGQAIYVTPKRGGARATYVVARLLIEDRYGGLPPYSTVTCACGLSQCVRPDHWHVAFPPAPLVLRADAALGWALVSRRDGRRIARAACVCVSVGPDVHVADTVPGRPLVARCGAPFSIDMAVVTSRFPTCEACR